MSKLHSWRNRDTLTVLMFHRVLPAEDCSRSNADRQYTVTPEFLTDCVAFIRRHYTPVSLDDVLAARRGAAVLPPYAMLVTFDDGWRDNLTEAAAVLGEMPWVVFVNAEAIQQNEYWWQEVILWALRSGQTTSQKLWELASEQNDSDCTTRYDDSPYTLFMRFGSLSPEARGRALAVFLAKLQENGTQRHTLTPYDVERLHQNGVGLGAHGATHLPLTLLTNAKADILCARDFLVPRAGTQCAAAMSFPHGRYNSSVVDAARSAGYQLLFTSDGVVNSCPNGKLVTDILGRIPMTTECAVDATGRFLPQKLATWLFLRTRAVLTGNASNA